MPTKLSVFCDKVIEAGWLTAIVVVPLFFNVYSSRVFDWEGKQGRRAIHTMAVRSQMRLIRGIRRPSSGDGYLKLPWFFLPLL
jgi:hypothetical protein